MYSNNNHWKKLGVVFDPKWLNNRPEWMNDFAQAPNAIVLEDRIRVYFCCRPISDSPGNFISRCAFVDLDINNPLEIISIAEKPILELGKCGDFDEYGTYPVSIFKNEKTCFAIYGGWTRCNSVPFDISLGIGFSEDGGITFKKRFRGPILSSSPDEPFVITSPKIRYFYNKWYLTYTAGCRWIKDHDGRPEIIYKLRMATSDDLINWNILNKNIVTDKLGESEAQACGDIFWDGNQFNMHFCYREALDFRSNKNNSYRIGYCFSTDLFNWHRDDSKVDLDVSISGWDSEMVAYPNVFSVKNKIYMLYGGNGNGKTGFGIAKLSYN